MQPTRETALVLGTGSATTALCLVTAISWPPWMVAVVGMGCRHGVGILAEVELARQGPVLEAPVESVPSTVVP